MAPGASFAARGAGISSPEAFAQASAAANKAQVRLRNLEGGNAIMSYGLHDFSRVLLRTSRAALATLARAMLPGRQAALQRVYSHAILADIVVLKSL
jgi:hypothetical protein